MERGLGIQKVCLFLAFFANDICLSFAFSVIYLGFLEWCKLFLLCRCSLCLLF